MKNKTDKKIEEMLNLMGIPLQIGIRVSFRYIDENGEEMISELAWENFVEHLEKSHEYEVQKQVDGRLEELLSEVDFTVVEGDIEFCKDANSFDHYQRYESWEALEVIRGVINKFKESINNE